MVDAKYLGLPCNKQFCFEDAVPVPQGLDPADEVGSDLYGILKMVPGCNPINAITP